MGVMKCVHSFVGKLNFLLDFEPFVKIKLPFCNDVTHLLHRVNIE
jgi:hypothetical protein